MDNKSSRYESVKQLFIGYSEKMDKSEESDSSARYMMEVELLKKMKEIATNDNLIEELEYIKLKEDEIKQKLSDIGITIQNNN